MLSKEWRQHGYREITNPIRLEEIASHYERGMAGGTQHKFDNKSLYWEADWADIGQASEFVRDWHNSHWSKEELKVSSFQLLNYLPFTKNYSELLDLRQRHMVNQTNNGEQFTQIVQPYVRRKLAGVQSIIDLKDKGAGEGFLNIARERHWASCTHNRRLSNLWSSIN